MRRTTLELCKRRLLEMLSRLTDDVNRMIEAVPDDLQAPGALSHAPTHPADQAATEGIDKEMTLIRNEQELHAAVRAALARMDEGNYGRCLACGGEIATARLDAIPYAEHCITCAENATDD